MGFILVVHVILCVLLVISILMQAGRGGGLAESFTSAESMFGTQTNSFMVRTSTILAALFLVTSLVLAVNSSKKEKSLMDNPNLLKKATAAAPAAKVEAKPTIKIDAPKPMDAKEVTGTPTAKPVAPKAETKEAVVVTNSTK